MFIRGARFLGRNARYVSDTSVFCCHSHADDADELVRQQASPWGPRNDWQMGDGPWLATMDGPPGSSGHTTCTYPTNVSTLVSVVCACLLSGEKPKIERIRSVGGPRDVNSQVILPEKKKKTRKQENRVRQDLDD